MTASSYRHLNDYHVGLLQTKLLGYACMTVLAFIVSMKEMTFSEFTGCKALEGLSFWVEVEID